MSNKYNNSLQSNNIDLQGILDTINNLPEAGDLLPELTNEGTSSDMLAGKQLVNSSNQVVTGTIPTKAPSDLTASGATVTVPSGYYATQATKSVSTATQATPSVSIDANGLITASATQTAGYVSAGTKSATKQLTTQAAKTVTPTKSSQTAVSSGVYTTGAVTVGAIPSEYIVPSGTKSVTTNGTHDVNSYASVEVNVASTAEDLDAELDTQEAKLDELLALLDTKAVGVGNSETCTVDCDSTDSMQIKYTALVNGEPVIKELLNPSFPLSDVVKNTLLYIYYSGGTVGCWESWHNLTGGLEELVNCLDYSAKTSQIVILVRDSGTFSFTEDL